MHILKAVISSENILIKTKRLLVSKTQELTTCDVNITWACTIIVDHFSFFLLQIHWLWLKGTPAHSLHDLYWSGRGPAACSVVLIHVLQCLSGYKHLFFIISAVLTLPLFMVIYLIISTEMLGNTCKCGWLHCCWLHASFLLLWCKLIFL